MPGRPPQTHSQTYPNAHSFPHPLSQTHPQSNGQHASVAQHREVSGTRENLSGPDDSEEEEEDEEEEAPPPRWQGIESIFEAYQEYIEGKKLQFSCFLHSRYKNNLFSGKNSEPYPFIYSWNQGIIKLNRWFPAVLLMCGHMGATFFLHLA